MIFSSDIIACVWGLNQIIYEVFSSFKQNNNYVTSVRLMFEKSKISHMYILYPLCFTIPSPL
jgi:hypothetical protein